MLYVASSWRNERLDDVFKQLATMEIPYYDFRNPMTGFHWGEVGMPSYRRGDNNPVPVDEYLGGIGHLRAIEGFTCDFNAMHDATAMLLVLPCGKSAHLELGWAVGRRLPTAILLEDPMVPELMYRMVQYMSADVHSIIDWARRNV